MYKKVSKVGAEVWQGSGFPGFARSFKQSGMNTVSSSLVPYPHHLVHLPLIHAIGLHKIITLQPVQMGLEQTVK